MRTNIPDINHAWYLTEKFDFLNSMMMSGRATSNPIANKHHMMRNHLRRGHLQNAKTLAMVELLLSRTQYKYKCPTTGGRATTKEFEC